jgi:RNA polymerase sigma factor (sigma-70 family)
MSGTKKNAGDGEVGSVSMCLKQFKEGDSTAAQNLWERYYHRLIGLARKKLGDTSRRAMDEHDVVQNAFASFCRRAQAGDFPGLQDRQGLWALLAVITARTAANQRLHETRIKRGSGRQPQNAPVDPDASDWQLMQLISEGPSAEDAYLFVVQLERFMDSLADPDHRLILLWKLEERTNEEIAGYLDCSVSSVERKLRSIRRQLKQDIANVSGRLHNT